MPGPEKDDDCTVEDMTSWLHQETLELTKAMELRMKEATDFVSAFASGRITAQEAENRLQRYQDRWGDSAVPGVTIVEGMTDEDILKKLDQRIDPEVRRLPWWQERDRSERSR
jgi:hypothetical protein